MHIVVKGNHTKVPERFRRHVSEKLAKVERLAERTDTIDVVLSKERNPRRASGSDCVELTVRAPGPVVRAEAHAPDPYAAFDSAWGKLEGRLRKLKDKRKIHHKSRTPVAVFEATALAQSSTAAIAGELIPQSTNGSARQETSAEDEAEAGTADDPEVVAVEMEGTGPLVVREKSHSAGPMSIEAALFAMELVGHDFYLFRDTASGQPSVVYRRRGYDYGVIRLEDEHAGQQA